jgi:xylulokinase
MPEYLCTFDIGTSGVKAGILTPEGELLGMAYREYPVIYPESLWVEQSIEQMWQSQCDASQELLARTGIAPEDIAAVGISCQRATFAPLDEARRPLTNFIGWQDKRSLPQCEEMRRLIGDREYYRIAGLPIEPTAAISKILWLKERQPEIFDRAAQFASTQNIHLQQMGAENPPCDLPDAAYMGLLDVDRLIWSEELLDLFGIPREKMPSLAPSGLRVGNISKEASIATGLAPGTPLVTAGGDLQCAGIGVGITEDGLVGVGIGTGADVVIYLDRPVRHPEMGLNCLPHAMAGAWEMEGLCLASGAAYKWFRDNLATEEKETARKSRVDVYDVLNAAAETVPPGSNGLLFLPSLMGAGAPHWDPTVSGVVIGLSLTTSRNDLARAILEGVCFEIKWMLESIEKLGRQIDRINIYGGAAKSRLWNQIATDIYGIPLYRPQVKEGGLVGAAICAGVGVGLFADTREGACSMIHFAEQYDPQPQLHARYTELFQVYQKAYLALTSAGVFKQLSSLAG